MALKLTLLLLFSLPLFCRETVYILTIPKSGTHCIEKYIHLLHHIGRGPPCRLRRSHFSESYLNLPEGHFDDPRVRKILLVRDLRDLFLSARRYILETEHWLNSSVTLNGWEELPIEEQLIELFDYRRRPEHLLWSHNGRTLPEQMKKTIDRARALIATPQTLLVHFEDLSGNNGPKVQKETLCAINTFLNVRVNSRQMDFLQETLFGNKLLKSDYFKTGKSGTWRQVWTDELKEQFSQLYGEGLMFYNDRSQSTLALP